MKSTLKLRPTDYFLRRMMFAVRNNLPITPNDQHRLENLRALLSGLGLDFLTNYYLEPYKKMNNATLARLKKQLEKLLRTDQRTHVELPPMRPHIIQQLRALSVDELILYHGNQHLTGAPFFHGGIQHILFFQWGNLFGVAKYVVLAEENALEANVLIHFEHIHERTLEQAVEEYRHHHWLQHPQHPMPMPHPKPILHHADFHHEIPQQTHIEQHLFTPQQTQINLTNELTAHMTTPKLQYSFHHHSHQSDN